jgi:hypothetical protein
MAGRADARKPRSDDDHIDTFDRRLRRRRFGRAFHKINAH